MFDAPLALADDTPLDALRFTVVDVETTGMSPVHGDRVTEIAAVASDGEGVRTVVHTLVNPERWIPARIQMLTGISEAMVADAPRFRAVAPAVRGALAGRVFVAHNASFDWGFVSYELTRSGEAVPEVPRLCTVRLARRLLPQLPRRSLDHVTAHYGVRIGARHRANGDATATAHVQRHLLDDAAERGVTTWGALEAMIVRGTGAARRRRSSRLPRPMDLDSFDQLP